MKTVFVLQHSYSLGDCEEVKLIGVYASLVEAEAAVSRLRDRPGFRNYPDGFNIDAYEIGQDHWQEGFATIVTIMIPILDENIDVWRPVQAEVLASGHYRIVSQNDDDDEHWAFTTDQIVECEERFFEGEPHLVAISLAIDDAQLSDVDRQTI
jgi:hypothetical protein